MSNAAQTTANVTTGVSVATGTMTASGSLAGWISSNSVLIGIVCTVLSLLVALVFHIINLYQSKARHREDMALKRAETIHKMRMSGMSQDEITNFLNLAGVTDMPYRGKAKVKRPVKKPAKGTPTKKGNS